MEAEVSNHKQDLLKVEAASNRRQAAISNFREDRKTEEANNKDNQDNHRVATVSSLN